MSTIEVLGRRRFAPGDQDWFAGVSGDANPIHVDQLVARRAIAGSCVVHGTHLALWAIDRWLAAHPTAIERIRASFLRPVTVGEEVEVRAVTEPDGSVQLQVAGARDVRAVVVLSAAPEPSPIDAADLPRPGPAGTARDLGFEAARGLDGEVPLSLDGPALATALPVASEQLSPTTMAGMLAISRIVGMECPGLHSLLVGFDVRPADRSARSLRWEVTRASSPRAPITLRVSGSLDGTVTAFFRPPPREQPSYAVTAAMVDATELVGQRALVVGGSRGLGELTAKVVAAGGGHVTITYARGSDDAERVAREIRAGGGDCDVRRFDVTAPAPLHDVGATHLYYFATPHIRGGGAFDPALLRELLEHYVDGFRATCEAARSGRPLRVLYPSTVFVAAPDSRFAEYAIAKLAGEALCAWMSAHVSDLDIRVERLPRLATDQTASLVGPAPMDALPALLAAVRALGNSSTAVA